MGIYDREYVRQGRQGGGGFGGGGIPTRSRLSGWSFNTWLIVVNIAIFVVQSLVPPVGQFLFEWGHFSSAPRVSDA